MSHDHWWMSIDAGGKYFHQNIGVQNGQLWVRLSDQRDENTEWEGTARKGRVRALMSNLGNVDSHLPKGE